MELFSQKTSSGPSIGKSNILSLLLSKTIHFVAILNATNSDPKIEDFPVFFRLETQIINKLFK